MFIQCQTNHGGAVLFAQGQNAVQHLLLAVDRVYDRLAVINAQRAGQSIFVGRIQLQWQVGDGLQLPHQHFQRGGFVNTRQTGIHVQQLGTGFGLGYGLGAGIGAVALPQGLLQALFAGGVDALAHHGNAVYLHAAHGGTQAAAYNRGFGGGGFILGQLFQQADGFRLRAAAAAQHGNSGGQVGGHLSGKLRRGDIIAAVQVRQARIGLDKHRHTGGHHTAEPLSKGQDFLGAQRAVDAHGVRTKAGGGNAVAFHGASGKGTATGLKAHRGKHRQVTVFLCGQDGGFQLIQVGHCFQKDEVCPGCGTGAHHLSKLGAGILKRQGTGRGQQLADGADIQCHQGTGFLRGGPGTCDGRFDHLLHSIAGSLQFTRVGAKGVCQQDIRPGAGIVPVDGSEHIRHDKGGQFRLLFCGQAAQLQLGAHGAIQHNKAAAGKYFLNFHRWFPSFCIRTFRAAGSARTRRGPPLPGGPPRQGWLLRFCAGSADFPA